MNNKFSFGKFILDCIISFGVMIIAIPILFLPSFFIGGTLFDFILQDLEGRDFYYYALALTLSNIIVIFPLKYFYKTIYVLSLIIICVLLSSYWWYLAYDLAHGGFTK